MGIHNIYLTLGSGKDTQNGQIHGMKKEGLEGGPLF